MTGRTLESPGVGFGLAVVKREGYTHNFKTGKSHKTTAAELRAAVKRGPDYMELLIPKNMSRARVHKMVDEWLDDRANGFRGSL